MLAPREPAVSDGKGAPGKSGVHSQDYDRRLVWVIQSGGGEGKRPDLSHQPCLPKFTRVDNLRCTLCHLDLARNPPNCPKQKRIGPQLITPEASFLLL